MTATLDMGVVSYRTLIDEALFDRLARRVVHDEGIILEQAEQIMDATLGFLKMCADYPRYRFNPSPQVDIGWHTFLLYTKEYTNFCYKIAGRFLHHAPNDDPHAPQHNGGIKMCVEFMDLRNVPFDREMWALVNGDCTVDCRPGGLPSNCTCS